MWFTLPFRIFEKDEHVLILNKTSQKSQLFLPNESQKLVRPINILSSEPRVIGTVSVYFQKLNFLCKHLEEEIERSNFSYHLI